VLLFVRNVTYKIGGPRRKPIQKARYLMECSSSISYLDSNNRATGSLGREDDNDDDNDDAIGSPEDRELDVVRRTCGGG
jgi:hypothetical protein